MTVVDEQLRDLSERLNRIANRLEAVALGRTAEDLRRIAAEIAALGVHPDPDGREARRPPRP